MTTRDEIHTLREKAEAAYAGPWEAEEAAGRGSWIKAANGHWCALSCGEHDEDGEANAAYIAAASPDVILRLLDERDALLASRTSNEALVKALEWTTSYSDDYEESIGAATLGGHYSIRKIMKPLSIWLYYFDREVPFRTIDEAKAAAQSDYASRIRSALSVGRGEEEAPTAAEINAAFDPADEAFGGAFRDGFREGWLLASSLDFEDREELEADYHHIVDIAPSECWDAYRQKYFATLPLAAIPAPPALSPHVTDV